MPRNTRYTLPPSKGEKTPALTPRALNRQEFGRRLNSLMLAKDWNQSELARNTIMPNGKPIGRFSISNYINGKSFPTPVVRKALAKAFGITPDELLPNGLMSAMDEEVPALEIKMAAGHPGRAWVRINQLLPTQVAYKIMELVTTAEQDSAAG